MNQDKWSRNRRNRYNWNKSRRNKYRWNRLLCSVSRWTRGRSLYYGLAIAASLLIISGLLSSLSSREEEKVKKQPDTSRQHAEEGQEPQLTENPNIRVLIMTTGHAGIVHPGVEVSSPAGLVLSFGEEAAGDRARPEGGICAGMTSGLPKAIFAYRQKMEGKLLWTALREDMACLPMPGRWNFGLRRKVLSSSRTPG